jgi:putative permease
VQENKNITTELNQSRTFGWRNWLKVAGVMITILLVLLLFFSIEALYLPILISLIIVYLVDPLISYLERYHISRTVGTLILFLIASGIFLWFLIYLLPVIQRQVNELQQDIPGYISSLQVNLNKLNESYPMLAKTMEEFDITSRLTDGLRNVALRLFSGSALIIQYFITLLILVPLFTFFILKDKREIKRSLFRLIPNRYFEMSLNLSSKIDAQIGDYIRGKIVESTIIGVVIAAGLYFLNIKYAIMLGVIGGLLNLIPYLGPVLGAIPGLLFAFMQKGADPLLGVFLVYVAAQLLDNIVLIPTIVARSADLHPILVLVAVIVGSYFMGILGMIIFVPIVSILKMIVTEIYEGLQSLKH